MTTAVPSTTPAPKVRDDDTLMVRALREAVVTMLAAIAASVCAWRLDPEPGPVVLAVVLCLSLSRSHLDRDRRGTLEAALVLPVVGLTAIGVGHLLRLEPWIGAAVFTSGMFVSIWLRRFGPVASRIGSLVALPFITLLTTPYIPSTREPSLWILLLPVVIAWLALAWVHALHVLARRVNFLAPARRSTPPVSMPVQARSTGMAASTKMAIQMALALTVSFVIGYVFFAGHWAWVVLTALIVNSGNRGRLDVAHKSVLRVLGAAAGTLFALAVSIHLGAHDTTTAGLIFVVIFLGLWLRPIGYAWWALCVTVVLALLQGFAGTPALPMLWPRLEEIVIGAIIGVACAWFVFPVRSTDALRRRLADALAMLGDALDPATPSRAPMDFVAAVARVEQLRPAFHATRKVTRRFVAAQPADWIDTLVSCREPAIELIARSGSPGEVRRTVGAARKALRVPDEILPALQAVHRSLAGQRPDVSA